MRPARLYSLSACSRKARTCFSFAFGLLLCETLGCCVQDVHDTGGGDTCGFVFAVSCLLSAVLEG
eukprot:3882924-Pleurochrysis_carterae.AAC.1